MAVYAAARCGGAQEQLISVYNNDGPGFSTDMLSSPAYLAIREHLATLVPQSSIVGMLLDHEESYTVVHSTQVGILQHDPYSWQVLGPDLVRLDTVTNGSKFFSLTLKSWISAMEPAQRSQFVDALYTVLSATNASTLSELSAGGLKNAGAVLQAIRELDEGSRRTLAETLRLLLDAARQTLPELLPSLSATLQTVHPHLSL